MNLETKLEQLIKRHDELRDKLSSQIGRAHV